MNLTLVLESNRVRRGLVLGTLAICSCAVLPRAVAQQIATSVPESTSAAQPTGLHGMTIDRLNHVHIPGSRQTLTLDEVVAALGHAGDTDQVREVVAVLRKRMALLNAELHGTRLAKNRIENQIIAVRRTMRANDRYVRVPGGSESDRPQRIAQQVNGLVVASETVKTSVAEEQHGLGHGAVAMAPYLTVVPRRYASVNHDVLLAERGLRRAEARSNDYDAQLAALGEMKRQVASSLVLLESTLGRARIGTLPRRPDCRTEVTGLESARHKRASCDGPGSRRDEFRGVCYSVDREAQGW